MSLERVLGGPVAYSIDGFITVELVRELLTRDHKELSLSLGDINRLQKFINMARSEALFLDYPKASSAIQAYATSNDSICLVMDVMCVFLEDGGTIGSQAFQKVIRGLVDKGHLQSSIISYMEKRGWLKAEEIQVNLDGMQV